MGNVTVYSFLINDQGKPIQVPSKRTIEDIELLGGIVVAGTGERVDENELREDGRYLPRHAKEDDQRVSAAALFQPLTIIPANKP